MLVNISPKPLSRMILLWTMIANMIEKLEYLNRQSEILLKLPTNAQNVPEFGEFIKLVIEFRRELHKTKTALEKLKKERKNYWLVSTAAS